MTKLKLSFFLFIICLLGISCEDEEVPAVQPVDFEVSLKYGEAYGEIPAPNVKVKALNVDNQLETEILTNEQGIAYFEGLPVGFYDITATLTFSPEEFEAFAGNTVSSEVVFNASVTNQLINSSSKKKFVLELASARVGDLVIKQIYYAGSHILDGAVFRDQFIEIHNNSDEVIYADGLYFSQLIGNNSSSIPDPRPSYLQEDGQYDWSKSIGMPSGINANKDYVYTKSVFQIPGSGEEYPVQPGESIVIAQNALNHQAPYQDQNGNTVTPNDPELTVDLSNADFEAFYDLGFNSDIDNPSVPNILVHQPFGKDMILDPLGRDAYAIFRLEEEFSSWASYPSPDKAEVTSSTPMHYQIPVDALIDAVETQADPQTLRPKKLGNAVDAGYTYVTLGSYSSQSVIREIAKTFNGRDILKDTNNSTADFKVLDKANPGGF
ncbi:MAG: DUF4876 domain-containing protein [Cyclobacteriaceae bacterium]